MAEQVSSLKTGIKYKDTPIGKIPVDWEVKRLEDTANNEKYSFTGGPFGSDLKEDSYTDDGVRVIQLQNIGDGKFLNAYKIFTSEEKANQLKSCNIYPGDIIIAKMADPVARACIIPDEDKRYLMASDGIRLSINKEKYDINFMLYAINSPNFRKNAESHSTGSTRLRIGLTELRNLLIAIPPLKDQKKIAEILTTVDEAIEKTSQIIEKTKEAKKGLMQRLFTRGIGHKKFKKTEIGEIPLEWEVLKLDMVGKLKGGTGFPERYQGNSGLKYLFIKVSDMNLPGNEVYIKTSINTIDEETRNIIKCDMFPKNTIIFAKVGAALLLNRRRILTRESAIDNNMMGLIIGNGNDPKFYYHILQTIDFAKYVFLGALPSVNQKVLGDIYVVSPPLNEQKQIAGILSSIDEEIEKESNHEEQLEFLKKGLMQVLLTGKIRVSI
jgi:type I restriction enzyme S subunit